jgi:hypothetical protein
MIFRAPNWIAKLIAWNPEYPPPVRSPQPTTPVTFIRISARGFKVICCKLQTLQAIGAGENYRP